MSDFLDKSDRRGNIIEGRRLNLPSVRDVLGGDPFSFLVDSPLTTLLTKIPDSNLVKGLSYAWTKLINNDQGTGGSINKFNKERTLLAMDEGSIWASSKMDHSQSRSPMN